MYISINWIKDFVDLDGIDIEGLIDKFTLSCAEVEGIEYKGKEISGIYTAKILSVANHPNSKKLHLLEVDTGDKVHNIVCGAPNVREGMITALATMGANVGGFTIGKATLGGCDSYGMCCSEHELGISDDHNGIIDFPADTPIGVDVKTILDIDDIIFEVDNKSLTNRPDLWGHYGIAREIAALTGRKLKPLALASIDDFKGKPTPKVSVTTDDCYRYTCATVENITKKTSNKNMQIRLYYCGMRGINLLADITNYIMLELGQPMHAFDNSIVKSIEVYNVKDETPFKTLDSNDRMLKEGTMVIATNGKPVAIAGVMGGENSEITDDTTSVLIESATFDGAVVRKTAVSLGMRTEASSRYEKSLDPELAYTALLRYVHLVRQEDNGAKVSSNISDSYNYHYPKLTIELDRKYIDRYIGISIPDDKILDILKSLEFDVTKTGDKFTVKVPSFRATKDINGKADIIEEITRVYGYDNIKPQTINQPLLPTKLDRVVAAEYDIKYALANRYNLNEIHSYIWYDTATNQNLGIEPKSVISCVNSINKENDKIRATMIPSLLKVVMDNKNFMNSVGVFEIGRVVKNMLDNGYADETKSLGIVLYNRDQDQNKLLLNLKEMIEYIFNNVINVEFSLDVTDPTEDYYHPVNFYEVKVDGQVVGNINLLHPNVVNNIEKGSGIAVCELNISRVLGAKTFENKFEKISKFPTTKLDFNFLIPRGKLYKDIIDIARSIDTNLNYNVSLLDIYDNETDSYISYTLHYEVNSYTTNLTSEDIDAFHKLVIEKFKSHDINLKV